MKIFMALIALILLALGLASCSSLGTRPGSKEKAQFKNSKNFNAKTGKFQNRNVEKMKAMQERGFSWSLFYEFFTAKNERTPKDLLPEEKPDLKQFLEPSQDLKVIWFGHSSFLLNMDGKIELVDPVFSESAAPVSFLVKRFQKPVLKLKELPSIDYVVISHDHYDHLDMDSIKYFVGKKTRK